MEYSFTGVPQTWAIIDGEPFILLSFEYMQQANTQQDRTHSHNISVNNIEITGDAHIVSPDTNPNKYVSVDTVPQTVHMTVLTETHCIEFSDALFQSVKEPPSDMYTGKNASQVQWIAQDLTIQQRYV